MPTYFKIWRWFGGKMLLCKTKSCLGSIGGWFEEEDRGSMVRYNLFEGQFSRQWTWHPRDWSKYPGCLSFYLKLCGAKARVFLKQ